MILIICIIVSHVINWCLFLLKLIQILGENHCWGFSQWGFLLRGFSLWRIIHDTPAWCQIHFWLVRNSVSAKKWLIYIIKNWWIIIHQKTKILSLVIFDIHKREKYMNQKLAPLRKSITLKKKKTEVLISKIDSSIFFFGEAGSNQSFRKWSNCIISLFCQFKFLFTNGFNERYNCWLLHTYQYLAKMSKQYLKQCEKNSLLKTQICSQCNCK